MSALVLIRHGQASFGAADYDVLSERGAEQSRVLGRFFARSNVEFDALYVGPRVRHRDTAAHMIESASANGRELPQPILSDGLDELPAFELVAHWMPFLEDSDPDLARAVRAGSGAAMMELFARWSDGTIDCGVHETYVRFAGRVRETIDAIRRDQGRGKNVAVVTSGGTIATTVGYALDLLPRKSMALMWSLVNSSVTELRYRPDDLGLVAFNRITHLTEPELVTTR